MAKSFYADDPAELVVLALDEVAIAASAVPLRWEDGGGGEFFPHIYGPILPAWVIDVRPAGFAGERFVMERDEPVG